MKESECWGGEIPELLALHISESEGVGVTGAPVLALVNSIMSMWLWFSASCPWLRACRTYCAVPVMMVQLTPPSLFSGGAKVMLDTDIQVVPHQ